MSSGCSRGKVSLTVKGRRWQIVSNLPYLVSQNKIRKEMATMASVQKFSESAVVNILRHNNRTIENPSNTDINTDRSGRNYSLLPDRGMTDYDFYKQRKKELYCFKRADVKVLAGWIVTAPQNLPKEQLYDFFRESYRFLADRYGIENTVQAVVHQDEGGQPHLHFCFIPVTEDKKHGGQKICADKVLDRRELRNFHPDLQHWLTENGINAKVITGVTKKQGGNRTVKELKQKARDWTVTANNDISVGRWG